MIDSEKFIPPIVLFPSGTRLYCEIIFHEGQTTNTTKTVITREYSYKSIDMANAFQQLREAKIDAYNTTKEHIKQFDEANPKGYIAWVKTTWYTDQTSQETMTNYMKGIQIPGIPPEF